MERWKNKRDQMLSHANAITLPNSGPSGWTKMKTNETSDQEKVPVVNCSTKDCPVAPFCATMAAIATIARRPLLISASNFLDFSCR